MLIFLQRDFFCHLKVILLGLLIVLFDLLFLDSIGFDPLLENSGCLLTPLLLSFCMHRSDRHHTWAKELFLLLPHLNSHFVYMLLVVLFLYEWFNPILLVDNLLLLSTLLILFLKHIFAACMALSSFSNLVCKLRAFFCNLDLLHQSFLIQLQLSNPVFYQHLFVLFLLLKDF